MGSTPTRSRQLLMCVVALATVLTPGGPLGCQEPVAADSTEVARVASPDSAGQQVSPGTAVDGSGGPPVSPMGAFFRSLILPGWGQAAVGQPGRGAFYFAMEATSLWMLYKTQSKLEAAERAGDEDLAAARQDQKEDWIVLAVFWALFAGVDAWVSTHMWDFEGAVIPPPDGSPGVAVQYSVPVGGP